MKYDFKKKRVMQLENAKRIEDDDCCVKFRVEWKLIKNNFKMKKALRKKPKRMDD